MAYLLTSFFRLRRRKGSNGFGLLPIEWPDLDAFCRHTCMNLAPWEIEIIEQLDDLFLATRNSTTHTEEGDDDQ